MDTKEKSTVPVESQKISRRTLIKQGLLGGAVLAAGGLISYDLFSRDIAVGLVEQGFVMEQYLRLQMGELIATVKKKAHEAGVELSENLDRKEIQSILTSSFDLYEQKHGKRPYFQKSKMAVSDAAFFGKIKEKLPSPVLPEDFEKLRDKFDGLQGSSLNLPYWETLTQINEMHTINIENPNTLLVPGSGIYDRFLQSTQTIDSSQEIDLGIVRNFVDQCARHEKGDWCWSEKAMYLTAWSYDFISREITEIKEKLGSDQTPEKLLVLYLDKNQGNIGKALVDMGMYLKAVSRNDISSQFFPYISSKTDGQHKIQDQFHFKDEYSALGNWQDLNNESNLDDTDKNRSWINQIGSMYHVFNQVGLLYYYDPQTIRTFVIGKNKDDEAIQGELKIATDYSFAIELPQVADLLKKYEKKSQPKLLTRRGLFNMFRQS